ncbi:hypothetical protein [Sulfoacidibacillus thermotolerans]|uniref:hypothetical protein n=1 Tax=Sulfoacidibacillus thermotolerans TaxID=1765684 RepID=UPI0015E80F9D|nr:hypothetical protein [Sulfoacidibacillus thermotolerans]
MACQEEWVVAVDQVLFNGNGDGFLYTICPNCYVQTPLSTSQVVSFLEDQSC